MRLRRAWEVKEGIELALSRGPIPPEYFDAVTSTPEESVELEYTVNSSRSVANLMKKY